MSTPTYSTRSHAVSEAVRDRRPFKTHGALSGRPVDGMGEYDWGSLHGNCREQFRKDADKITYVVWSYTTPIVWYVDGEGWRVTRQWFSRTTTAHTNRATASLTGRVIEIHHDWRLTGR